METKNLKDSLLNEKQIFFPNESLSSSLSFFVYAIPLSKKLRCEQAGLLLLWITSSVCGLFHNWRRQIMFFRSWLFYYYLITSLFVLWGKWYCKHQTYYALCRLLNNYFTHVNHIVLSQNETQIEQNLLIISSIHLLLSHNYFLIWPLFNFEL
jgi:hypothetical protein